MINSALYYLVINPCQINIIISLSTQFYFSRFQREILNPQSIPSTFLGLPKYVQGARQIY